MLVIISGIWVWRFICRGRVDLDCHILKDVFKQLKRFLHCFWILGFSYCTDDEEWRGRTEAATLWNRRIFLSVVNCRKLLRIIWLPDVVRTLFVVTKRSARRQNWDLFMMLVCVVVLIKSWELLTLMMSHSTLSCHQLMISLLSLPFFTKVTTTTQCW